MEPEDQQHATRHFHRTCSPLFHETSQTIKMQDKCQELIKDHTSVLQGSVLQDSVLQGSVLQGSVLTVMNHI